MTRNSIVHKSENTFWSGLAMGAIFGASSLFLLGTKRGRKFLKNVIDATEDIEEIVAESIDELENHIPEKKMSPQEIMSGHTVQSVIEKIQSVLPEKKEIKKYFVRDGKILK